MKKSGVDYLITFLGLCLLGVGLFLVKTRSEAQGVLRTLPYLFIGVGCGAFGGGMGNLISRRIMKNSPDLQKQKEIEENDERNIAIANRAKAKAYDTMIYIFGALILSFAPMGVDAAAVLLLVCAYLFVIGCGIYYRCKYDREM